MPSDSLHLYEDTFAGLELLDSVVGRYSVFMTGENHLFTESNARLWLKMIQYLHKQAGVRNIMFEYGYAYGVLVNEYIQTGDSNLYNALEHFGYVEYSRAFKDLMEWNLSLDSSERVQFFAIDIDRGIYPMLKLLDHYMPEELDAHDSIILHIETIRSLAAYNQYKLYEQENDGYADFDYSTTETIKLVQENFLRFEEEYAKVLGDKFDAFRYVLVDRLKIRDIWYDYENNYAAQQYVYREMFMHQEFLRLAAIHPGGWFGQFGRCHTTQTKVNSNSCEWYMFRSLANRIKNTKGGRYQDSLLSMAILYDDDRTLGIEFAEHEDLFDAYFEQLDPARIVLLDLSADSTLDSLMSQDFDYVFLNSYELEKDVRDYVYEYDPTEFEGIGFRTRLRAIVGQRSLDLGQLNQALLDEGVGAGFQETLSTIGAEWEWGFSNEHKYVSYFAMNFLYMNGGTIETDINNGTDFSLSAWKTGMHYRYNLIPSKRFELGPGLGMYLQRLNFKVIQQDPGLNSPLVNGFLGPERISAYLNPAFCISGSVFMNLDLNWFSIGGAVGYDWDLSRKEWMVEDRLIEDGLKTSLSGMYIQLKLGLSLSE